MYKYEDYKEEVMTAKGQEILMKTKDKVFEVFAEGGGDTMSLGQAIQFVATSGLNWQQWAYLDRLVELGYLYSTENQNGSRYFQKR